MGRLAQLVRDLFSVQCSETEALTLLLNGEPIASIRKPGKREGLLRKMRSWEFLANWRTVVKKLIVYWKIAISQTSARTRTLGTWIAHNRVC